MEHGPWDDVADPHYFPRVLKKFHDCSDFGDPKENKVRFGATGEGVAPNYQVQSASGEQKRCYNGLGHREASHVDEEFDPERLSRPFTYLEVQQMIGRLRNKPRPKGKDEGETPSR